MKKAIYAFSGDPITYGHIDIIERASKAFDHVIVGIGANPSKKYMFNLKERAEMASKSLINISNIDVIPFEGLLVDYAYENDIGIIVKGVRNNVDFDYENILHQVGESQKLGIDTHVLFAKPELSHISSSVVKGIQKEQGFIHDYVPLYVKQCLEERISGQYIVGVTGEIGSGKSYVGEKFVKFGEHKNLEVHNIELDYLGHQILSELKHKKYGEIRNEIVKTFGNKIRGSDGMIDRKILGEIVFNDPDALDKLNEIMHTPILVRLKRELYDKKGLLLFNAALIAESRSSYLCNNNIILVYADELTQERRLKKRGLTDEQINRRRFSQFNFKEKNDKLLEIIERDKCGKLWTLDNSGGMSGEIEKAFNEVVKEMNVK